ncbi:ETO1-like protein 1 [Camellia lanceoleosa]|uniref:ETO1-like protein 1 n=1 Tax=Camellia lanceoleosa TaxID=1840588 RepID=A0ACC0HT12_9ERIC|nr:ETO1-like protein 1 [Camellia lanceoleosa]
MLGTVRGRNVLVKGGDLASSLDVVDIFFDGDNFYELRSPRIRTRNTHGTGPALLLSVVHVVKSYSKLANNDLPVDIQRLRCRALYYALRFSPFIDNLGKEKEAIAELSRAIAVKVDLNLLHLRAAFHEHIGDVMGALRDYRVAVSVDPNHEMLELHSSREP